MVHGKNVRNGTIAVDKTTDDEYTPSVFSTYTYNTSGSKNSSNSIGGYIQWKPISYQSSGRKSTSSQQVRVIQVESEEECDVSAVPEGLASALYGLDVENSSVTVVRWFVVFGTPGDPTYIQSKYNTW